MAYQPGFRFNEIKVSEDGLKLANKFWSFLQDTVGKKMDVDHHYDLLQSWASKFDVCLKSNNFEHICEVFDFYVADIRKKLKQREKPFIYATPDAFIGDLYFLAKKFEANTRPIPEEELKDYLFPLRREQWQCPWDSLVTSVSKSVHSLRLFLKGLRESDIEEGLKRKIRSIFGDTHTFIIQHYQHWRLKHIDAVWTATITARYLFLFVRRFLSRYGYGESEINIKCEEIKSAMDMQT